MVGNNTKFKLLGLRKRINQSVKSRTNNVSFHEWMDTGVPWKMTNDEDGNDQEKDGRIVVVS